ncbi:MAG: hypothetical protein ACMXX7_00255 [Candidatus Woesearchaeota archaeon]
MFPSRFDFYKSQDGQDKFMAITLSPEERRDFLKENLFTREQFSEYLNKTFDSINRRDPSVFGFAKSKNPGVKEGELIDFYYEYANVSGDVETKKYAFSSHNLNGKSEFLVTFPSDSQGKKALKEVLDPKNQEAIQSLKDRLERVSHTPGVNKGIFFSEEELKLINNFQNSFGLNNLDSAHKYFSQVLSLFNNGAFLDLSDSMYLTMLKNGDESYEMLTNNPKMPVFDTFKTNGESVEVNEENFEKAKKLLGDKNPWYTRIEGTDNSLNMEGIVNSFYHLGKSFYDPGVSNVSGDSAIAAEHFIADVYASLTGKNSDGPTFGDKLKELNKTPALKGVLDDFIHIYSSKGKVTPSSHRGTRIHASRFDSSDRLEYQKENWTTFFYQDLVKSTLSALMGESKVFNDFDLYARNNNLHLNHNFATIDPAKSRHDKKLYYPGKK